MGRSTSTAHRCMGDDRPVPSPTTSPAEQPPDLIRLSAVLPDEFNQSAGRNLGFRRRGEIKHVLLVNRRLFGLLVGAAGALAHSRYDLRLHLDTDQRYEIKRAA
jgi:hypothetical protein